MDKLDQSSSIQFNNLTIHLPRKLEQTPGYTSLLTSKWALSPKSHIRPVLLGLIVLPLIFVLVFRSGENSIYEKYTTSLIRRHILIVTGEKSGESGRKTGAGLSTSCFPRDRMLGGGQLGNNISMYISISNDAWDCLSAYDIISMFIKNINIFIILIGQEKNQ